VQQRTLARQDFKKTGSLQCFVKEGIPMSRKRERVHYQLDSGEVGRLTDEEIRAILRAADELIATGGRSILAKILKESKDRKVLEHGLDQCPVYGYYRDLTLAEITHRIDWMIKRGFLAIQYNDRLPLLVFTESGWEIERETYAEELLQKLKGLLDGGDYSFVNELKDRNRGMILLLIAKIKQTKNARFIPLLKQWQANDYKKVRAALKEVIEYLAQEGMIC
jgi:superfamily II DNA helicase RecQ